jgi:peptidoglycan/LPS O-acetylase OafA/YrhL
MNAVPHQNYRADIDGLRALSVILIVLFHANNAWLPGGFIGVDIFFVISGYLITQILLREQMAGQFSILRFYARRVRRIFPALIVMLASVLVAGWFLLSPEEYKQVGKHISGAAVFFSNFILKKESGYFDTVSDLKPLLHLWSLAVEEQFYLLWPLGLWLALKSKRFGWPALYILSIASLLFAVLKTPSAPEDCFFLLPARFWELAIGGLLAHAQLRQFRLPSISAWIGLALIVIASVIFDRTLPYPGWRALLPVLGATLLLGSSSPFIHQTLLSHRLMVSIGRISYPLYLWHWPLFAFARTIVWQGPSQSLMVILTILSVLLAWATTRYIEAPIRFGALRNRAVILPLIMGLAILGIIGNVIDNGRGIPATRSISNPLFTDLIRGDEFRKAAPPCAAAMGAGDLWCNLAHIGTPTAAVFGDSHANHLFPGLAQDKTRNWLLIGYSSCPPLAGIAFHPKNRPDDCTARTDRSIDILARTPTIDTVVLASLGSFYLGHSLAANHTGKLAAENWQIKSIHENEKSLNRSELFYRGMDRTITTLERAGKRVILFEDVPAFDFYPSACIARTRWLKGFVRTPCAIERTLVEEDQKSYREILKRLHHAHPKTTLYSPRAMLCDATWCYAGNDAMLFYHDSHHLSIRGSALVAKDFLRNLH